MTDFLQKIILTKACSLGQLTDALFEAGGSKGGICNLCMMHCIHPIMKTLLFTFLATYVTVINAQEISIHSITTARMPTGDNGYTLDGSRMVDSRAKLLNPANFGPQGVYPKGVSITDAYVSSGSLTQVSNLPVATIFFFGSFQTNNQSLAPFTQAELDSLYNWSLRGGKVMIAAGSSEWNLGVLGEHWGFNVQQASPSFFIPNEIGQNTSLFNGPFGTVESSSQGGGAQGYFDVLTASASVLATDSFGRPTLIIDCTTMDLIAADVDGFTNYNQSQGAQIVNEKDRFFANIFAFMDEIEDPPQIAWNQSVLSVEESNSSSFQWFYNGHPIEGATASAFLPTESGVYRVETMSMTGCANSSSEVVIEEIVDFDESVLFPNVFTPNEDGINALCY
jgi:hypothetical protein